MAKRLRDNLNSDYFSAINGMRSKTARKRIVAYVESYDDVFFWRKVLGEFEDDRHYFEVMLPSKVNLAKGKKQVLMNLVGDKVGEDMIACVDADYDFLMQGATKTSENIVGNPYVFHTYVYAIENYQCFAPSLHDVCVMVTLNDCLFGASGITAPPTTPSSPSPTSTRPSRPGISPYRMPAMPLPMCATRWGERSCSCNGSTPMPRSRISR